MIIENAEFNKDLKAKKLRVMMVARFLRGYEGITSHIATLGCELQKNGCVVKKLLYQDYYTLENKKIVANLSQKDIEILNYQCD